MVNRTTAVTITLATLIGLSGLPACRKDKAEGPEAAPAPDAAPAEVTLPPQQTSTGKNVSQVQAAPEPFASQPDEPTAATTETTPLFSVAVTLARNKAIRAAQQQLLARWDEIQSVSAKIKLEYDQQEGLKQRRSGEGTYDCTKKDEKTLIRMKIYHSMIVERKEMGDWVLTGERILKVYDGEFLYTLDELHAGMTATKSRPSRGQLLFLGGRHLLNQLRRFNNFKRLPDETIDGHTVSVFKGVSDPGNVKTEYYIDQETGLLIKVVTENETRKSKLTMRFTDIQLNPQYAEDHFTFTPPEGVEIQDLTKPDSSPNVE